MRTLLFKNCWIARTLFKPKHFFVKNRKIDYIQIAINYINFCILYLRYFAVRKTMFRRASNVNLGAFVYINRCQGTFAVFAYSNQRCISVGHLSKYECVPRENRYSPTCVRLSSICATTLAGKFTMGVLQM